MKKSILTGISAGLLGLGMMGSANAALLGRLPTTPGGTNYQAYYDNVANLTWLADANYAATSGYAAANATGAIGSSPTNIQADGGMGWQAANDWAAQLTVGGVSGWRLPATIDVGNDGETYTIPYYQGVDAGFNITTPSEMSNMYYNVLGNTAAIDTSGMVTACRNTASGCLTNTGPFSNLHQPAPYWSATEYAPDTSAAWGFFMGSTGAGAGGLQTFFSKNTSEYGWAVHSGDVSTVPVPAAIWLFGSGLLGLIGVARRKRANP